MKDPLKNKNKSRPFCCCSC